MYSDEGISGATMEPAGYCRSVEPRGAYNGARPCVPQDAGKADSGPERVLRRGIPVCWHRSPGKTPGDSVSGGENVEALLTTQEVANILKVTVRTVYSLLESGELQGVKIGRVWRVREEDLQAFLSRPALKGEEQT